MGEMHADGRLLTPTEVAEKRAVSVNTVRRLANSGQLPGYRLGRKNASLRFDPQEVDAWLKRPEEPTPGGVA